MHPPSSLFLFPLSRNLRFPTAVAVLTVGGYGSAGYLASAELYNPSTGTWTAPGNMTEPREYFQAVLLPNSKGWKSSALDGREQ